MKTWLYCISLSALLALIAGNKPLYADKNPAALSFLEQPELIPQWIKEGRLKAEDIPNPHWQEQACMSCHTGKPAPGTPALRNTNSEALCANCHGPLPVHAYIHISDVKPDSGMLKRMPEAYRQSLQQGKLACISCHDLKAQCLKNRRGEQFSNPGFLRGAPFSHRTDLCFRCHDAKSYQRINPHDQISDDGKVRNATCLLCHETEVKLKTGKSIREVDFNVENDLAKVCTGCHLWVPHPGGRFMFAESYKDRQRTEHLSVPSEAMKKHMLEMEAKNNIALPLDPTTGKVFCGTCHNAHEKGLIKNAAAAKGAGEKYRLRMQQICTNCHEK